MHSKYKLFSWKHTFEALGARVFDNFLFWNVRFVACRVVLERLYYSGHNTVLGLVHLVKLESIYLRESLVCAIAQKTD